MCQLWIRRRGRSGLLTCSVATARRFVVRADEKLTAFLELESAIRAARGLAALVRRRRFLPDTLEERVAKHAIGLRRPVKIMDTSIESFGIDEARR